MTSFLLFSFSKLMENTAGFFTQKKFSKGLKLVVKNFNWTLSCTIQREIMLVISNWQCCSQSSNIEKINK